MTSTYNAWLVALSIMVAIAVSYTALRLAARVATSESRGARGWLAAGAFAMGFGIWTMHFIGMLAFSMPIQLTYHIPTTIASLAIAIGTSGFALAITAQRQLTSWRLGSSALVMGAGISLMHYVGMAAIAIFPVITYDRRFVTLSILIAVAASFAALWLFHRLRDDTTGHNRLIRIAAAIVMGLAISGMHYTGMAAAHFAAGSYCTGGVTFDNAWLAGTIGMFSIGLLVTMLVTAVYDAHLQSSTRRHALRLEQINAELQRQATHDALTDLPNRILYLDRLGQAIARAKRSGNTFAILVIDLDRFKVINDTLGHAAGDRLLIEVARRLSALVRAEDTVARTGGDEFLLLIDELGERADAAAVARKVCEAMSDPFVIDSARLHTTASIGISVFPDDGTNIDELVAHADEAMYCAKAAGRNTFQFYNADSSVFSLERLDLENDLRCALALGQFELHYQPKVDVVSGRMNSVEALLRWHHPTRGLVPPVVFIPIAEEAGLIFSIGEWVLREACEQARRWQQRGLPFLRVAVNVSPSHFRQCNFVDAVRTALLDSDLEPQYLEIELTEATVMDNAEAAVALLEELSRMGIVVSIDDFGTGYSSMSYLRRFPIDKLKIDRSFISDLTTNTDAASIVKAIISLAHSLRLRVVAEGVETPEQLELLRTLGCDQYQGYLRSPAVPAAEIDRLAAASASDATTQPREHLRTHSKLAAYRRH